MSETRKPIDWTKPLQRMCDGKRVARVEANNNKTWPHKAIFVDGESDLYTEGGFFFFDRPDHRDLINVPESAEAVAHDDLRERVEDHGRRLDEFWKRVDKIEDRLANIERAPVPPLPALPDDESGEPEDCEPVVTREPSVVYPDAPPFRVGQAVECVDAGFGNRIKNGERYTVQQIRRELHGPGWMVSVQNDGWNYAHRFRALPPTAERGESEPTPGMVAAAKNIGMYCDRQKPEYKKVSEIVSVETMATVINRHVGPELSALRAEIERLKALDKDYCDSANKYAQEIGDLRQQLATTREAAEAMESIKSGEVIDLCSWIFENGKKWIATNRYGLTGSYQHTPTAAILAAKATTTTTPPEPRP